VFTADVMVIFRGIRGGIIPGRKVHFGFDQSPVFKIIAVVRFTTEFRITLYTIAHLLAIV